MKRPVQKQTPSEQLISMLRTKPGTPLVTQPYGNDNSRSILSVAVVEERDEKDLKGKSRSDGSASSSPGQTIHNNSYSKGSILEITNKGLLEEREKIKQEHKNWIIKIITRRCQGSCFSLFIVSFVLVLFLMMMSVTYFGVSYLMSDDAYQELNRYAIDVVDDDDQPGVKVMQEQLQLKIWLKQQIEKERNETKHIRQLSDDIANEIQRHQNEEKLLIESFLESDIFDSSDKPTASTNTNGNANIAINGNDFIDTMVIVFCYNRPEYLETTLQGIVKHLPNQQEAKSLGNIKVVVSQDGENEMVRNLISKYQPLLRNGWHWQHKQTNMNQDGYHKLSEHYKWALDKAFAENAKLKRVIILEDDLEIACDFFEYMAAMAPLLDKDTSLIAASAWNDNGQAQFVNGADPSTLFRTDFFGGLGWMMPKRIWDELSPKWPEAYWDDWIRHPDRRQGRQFIYPEISRTVTFGKNGGASHGMFFDKYLKPMKLNNVFVKFTSHQQSIETFLSKNAFDEFINKEISNAKEVNQLSEVKPEANGNQQSYKFFYKDVTSYLILCRTIGIIDDVRSNIARGSFNGVVPIMLNNQRLFLVPETLKAAQ